MAKQPQLDPALEAKLRHLRLRSEMADQDTLLLKNVPANRQFFSKARTNLLIKRFNQNMSCVVCVDENLDYLGPDPDLVRAFTAGPRQNGWRILTLAGSLHGDMTAALDYALEFLGAEEDPGKVAAPERLNKGLLAAWAEDLTTEVMRGRAGPTLCRNEEVEYVATSVLCWQGRLPLIVGEAGTGKTNLLFGVAGLLARRKCTVLAVNAGALMAGTLFESEREAVLRSLLREAGESGAVLAIEQAEWTLINVPRGHILLREALDRGVRVIATSLPGQRNLFGCHPLASRLDVVQLNELCAGDACRVLEALRPSITPHHDVQIDAEVERAAVERSLSMEGCLPGKAVALLDAAAALANLNGRAAVTLMDVYLAASRMLGESG